MLDRKADPDSHKCMKLGQRGNAVGSLEQSDFSQETHYPNALSREYPYILHIISSNFLGIGNKRYDQLSELIDRFLAARKRAKQGSAVQELKKKFGILGTISVREVTWSEQNGWHPHCWVELRGKFRRALSRETRPSLGSRHRESLARFHLFCHFSRQKTTDSSKMRLPLLKALES